MALVLSRVIGEAITIGKDVIVRIGEVRGRRVKLVINAPKEVVINREEITKAISQHEGKS